MKKGCVCVTGGNGYLGSWMVKRLLEDGYSVHTTIRSNSGLKKDISYLTNLPGAAERLTIFYADLNNPKTFKEPIKGCIGVFHVAHTNKEPLQVLIERSIKSSLGVLQACLDSKTVKKVVYTSTVATVMFNGKNHTDVSEDECWSDIDYIRTHYKGFVAVNAISKLLTEKANLEFAEKNGLDLVTVLPTFVHGPFLGPYCPVSVRMAMAMIFGYVGTYYDLLLKANFVHVDDVARAHIHLFEQPSAKGRYICSKTDVTIGELYKFLSHKYPEYIIPSIDFVEDAEEKKDPGITSRKLLDTGFEFKYELEDMFDDAINCCKRNNIL